jgi:hypothetical protein
MYKGEEMQTARTNYCLISDRRQATGPAHGFATFSRLLLSFEFGFRTVSAGGAK